jgi:lipopolysaccharide transport system ATP-binding protein
LSSDVVIRANGLGKAYLVSHAAAERERYLALRDVLAGAVRGVAGWALELARGRASRRGGSVEEFWALKDVSFEIRRGEVVGIIGRNGAGKSTLLKILSRITESTRGRVEVRGRLASLLEVGTGFHPELTGRENIFLNGAILGMTRAEIRKKFDEIVAFASVEQFLDTPVKRYSSGMYVRLAFAVAAHLEPEILVVDEVLAVGDAEFQKKCIGKMQDVAGGGRTVLFVSHQMAAMQNLCNSGILLAGGKVKANGAIHDIVRRYLSESANLAQVSLQDRRDHSGTGEIRMTGVSFKDGAGNPVQSFTSGATAAMEVALAAPRPRSLRNVRIAVGVDSDIGQRVLVLSTHLADRDIPELPADAVNVCVRVPRLALAPGRYGFTLFCSVNGEVADWVKNAGAFDVEPGDFYGNGHLPTMDQGTLLMDHSFEVGLPATDRAIVAVLNSACCRD